jgi:hypothetical protein
LQLSIKEFDTALTMLAVRQDDINKDNKKYIRILMNFLKLEEDEKELDIAL